MTLKWEDTAFKDPLARAKGLGSAKTGLHHWVMQRVTAIAAIPLTLWAIWAVMNLADADYATFQDWISQLPNAVLLGLFVLVNFYHAALGLQVVIEDYVHSEWIKLAALLTVHLGVFALGATAIFSILKLAL
jgi:succinate dehydrogenase / fumarate reductase membrane anchor subunit